MPDLKLLSSSRLALVGSLWLLTGGCAHYVAPPLSVDRTGAELDTRTLDRADLRQFLTQNLGDANPTRDFDSLCWVAFYYNPSLAVARAQWEAGQAANRTASATPNPTLSLVPGYNTTSSGISPWFPAVTLDILRELGGKRDRREAAARLNAEAARQAVFVAAWQIRSELRQALLEFSVAQGRVDVLRAQATQQQKLLALLEQRLKAGAIASGEVSTARIAAVRAEAAAADAERQAPLARQRIVQALGVPVAALANISLPTPTARTLDAAQLTAARRQALQSRADVLAALARFDASQAALDLEIAKQRPDLHLGPSYQWDQGDNKWSIAFTFELPIFNHNEGPIAEAEAKRRELAAEFAATQARVIADIDTAIAGQQTATAQIDQLSRVANELAAQEAAAERRLRAGGADQVELSTAHLDRLAAELAVVEARAQATTAAGKLEDALQVPFSHLATLAAPPSSP